MRVPLPSQLCPGNRLLRWTVAICIVYVFLVARTTLAGTFGKVVPIGGHASDIALDEARGVVYVANFTANRIDVVSIANRKVQSSINVSRQPAAVALSPDCRYLVVTHVSNFETPEQAYKGITVLDLSGPGNVKQVYTLGQAPLGVAFGNHGQALVVTTTEFLLFDPQTGYTRPIGTVEGVTSKTLPQPVPEGSPREIIRASVTASGDGSRIFGSAEMDDDETKVLVFEYTVQGNSIRAAAWTAEPPLGPRVVSTDQTGSMFISGWGMFHRAGFVLAQFPDAEGKFQIGSHAVDAARATVYAQVAQKPPESTSSQTKAGGPRRAPAGTQPLLLVVDADNLNVRERLKLPENLSGRSILDPRGDVMYSVSESGLMILPVGSLHQQHRLAASQEDVVFRGSWCDRRSLTQEFTISNPGGGATDFSLSVDTPGVMLAVSSSTTPASVRVSVDMSRFQNNKGTTQAFITISSGSAINIVPPVRVLINNREPDQRGTFFNVPGALTDILSDPVRNRFYVVRQDRNAVLVFDASNYQQIATLRTGNTPWIAAITPDGRYLITGADNSQVAHVYDLEILQLRKLVVFPGGHYPRAIAASNNAILAATRVAGEKHTIDRIDIESGYATELPSLGVFENDIDVQTAMAVSPSGNSILIAQANGTVLLYDANSDTFVAGRKEYDELTGAVAALSDETFVVDRYVLNASLVTVGALDGGVGNSSGFAVADGLGVRTAAPTAASAGVVQRVNMTDATVTRAARLAEAPELPAPQGPGYSSFTRALVALPNGRAMVSLSTSGFTVLPWDYDAAVADPRIGSVVNAADRSQAVAPGGLISIMGTNLSPVNASTSATPLPTLLGDSCMTVNGYLVPMVFVSPNQVNGQLPFAVNGEATMILRTPSGVSNTFKFPVRSTAPGVFLVPVDGWTQEFPAVYRAANNQIATYSNPVHLDDWLVIYLTGMGNVAPSVATGDAAPAEPLAEASQKPEVTLGGTPLPVWYAGMTPGSVGVYQINVQVPFKGVETGMEVPLKITQGDYSTTINVRVVK